MESVAFDIKGHGNSEGARAEFGSVEIYVNDVVNFVKRV